MERRVVEQLAVRCRSDFWDVFVVADDLFERVALRGDERLARSSQRGSATTRTMEHQVGAALWGTALLPPAREQLPLDGVLRHNPRNLRRHGSLSVVLVQDLTVVQKPHGDSNVGGVAHHVND